MSGYGMRFVVRLRMRQTERLMRQKVQNHMAEVGESVNMTSECFLSLRQEKRVQTHG